jgi:hypothetical protein
MLETPDGAGPAVEEGVQSDPPRIHRLTLNGVEVEATDEELISGYMRQQDYTRKTQTLAEQRQELERAQNLMSALDADPQGTLRLMAKQLGMDEFTSVEDDDPVSQRLQALDREIATLRQREVTREVEREIDTLKSRYGVDDGQIQDVIVHATKHKINLQAAYRDLFFDDAFDALRTAQERKAKEELIIKDKTGPAGAIHLGVQSSNATGTESVLTRPKGIKEAYLMALRGQRYEGD